MHARPDLGPVIERTVARYVRVTERRCAWCGQWFVPRSPLARFCKHSHRVLADRQRRQLGVPTMVEAARLAKQTGKIPEPPLVPGSAILPARGPAPR